VTTGLFLHAYEVSKTAVDFDATMHSDATATSP